MKVEYNNILRSKLFIDLEISDILWSEFANKWKEFRVKKNQLITREGQVEKYVYFVIEGVQKLYFNHQNGKEYILGFSFDNSLSGVPDSMISQLPSKFIVSAITDSILLRIERDDFFYYIENNIQFERWWRNTLEKILLGRVDREVEIISCTAEERFEKLHKRSPRAIQLIPQKDLASYLSMSAETFSRIRAKIIS